MAQYNPPIENLPIFDSSLFDKPNSQPDLTGQYLQFPVAQGAEVLQDTTINGELLCGALATFNDGITMGDGSIINFGLAEGTSVDITSLDVAEIACSGAITCETLNYQNLNPPIAGAQNLEQTLTIGNDAESKTIANLGGLTMTGDINIGANQLTNWANGTITGTLYAANGNPLGTDTRAQFGVFNNNGNNGYIMGIGDTTGTLNEFNTFKIQDYISGQQYLRIDNSTTQQITLASDKLLYKTDSTNPANATAYILNSLTAPPMYKQIFSNVADTISNKVIASNTPYWLWGSKIYDGDLVFNYGINYGELLLSYFSITITSPTPWVGTNNCQLYLGNSPLSVFDDTIGNRIVFNCTNTSGGVANFTFTSTIPIILYYQNGDVGTSFNTLYFLASFQDAGTYSFQFNNCNFMTTGIITGKNTQPLTIND